MIDAVVHFVLNARAHWKFFGLFEGTRPPMRVGSNSAIFALFENRFELRTLRLMRNSCNVIRAF